MEIMRMVVPLRNVARQSAAICAPAEGAQAAAPYIFAASKKRAGRPRSDVIAGAAAFQFGNVRYDDGKSGLKSDRVGARPHFRVRTEV
jgi:hypothetical protein